MDANERGAARYRYFEKRVWTPAAERRFVRLVLRAFRGAYEIDPDGHPVALEQLRLEA